MLLIFWYYCLDQCYYFLLFFVTVPSAVVVWTGISQTISLSFPWGIVSVNMRMMNIDKSKCHSRRTVGQIISITFIQKFFVFNWKKTIQIDTKICRTIPRVWDSSYYVVQALFYDDIVLKWREVFSTLQWNMYVPLLSGTDVSLGYYKSRNQS